MERLRDRLNHIAAVSPPMSASFARRVNPVSPSMSAPAGGAANGYDHHNGGSNGYDRRDSIGSDIIPTNGAAAAGVDDDWQQLKDLRASRGPSSAPSHRHPTAAAAHAHHHVRSAERSHERAILSAESNEAVAEAKWLRANADVTARAMQQRYQADLQVSYHILTVST